MQKDGTYTFFAAVAAANSGSSFQLSLDGVNISSEIAVPAASSGEENYEDYNKVSENVELPAGEHILRLTVTGAWFDLDYFTFVAGANADDPEPIQKEEPSAIASDNLHFDAAHVLADYDVFDMQGVRMGRLSAYGIHEAVRLVKESDYLKNQGVYYIRSRKTNQMRAVRIVR